MHPWVWAWKKEEERRQGNPHRCPFSVAVLQAQCDNGMRPQDGGELAVFPHGALGLPYSVHGLTFFWESENYFLNIRGNKT